MKLETKPREAAPRPRFNGDPLRSHRIEVEVREDGGVDATLFLNGWPVGGDGDTTGTLSAGQLIEPLLSSLVKRVERDRAR